MTAAPGRDVKAANVAAYKTILRNILEERPSGTRQRLATALGKNRSFISRICNPAYPARFRPRISRSFSRSPFSARAETPFPQIFERAHPNRSRQVRESPSLRSLKLEVYDFGDEKRSRI